MKLDRNLNLVLTVDRTQGGVAIVHATPLSSAVFDVYWDVISQTWADMAARGISWVYNQGRLNAARQLEKTAKRMGEWVIEKDGVVQPGGAQTGLVGEIRRTTMVAVAMEGGGWDQLPLDQALVQNVFSEEDASEVLNTVVFFTLGWASVPVQDREDVKELIGMFGGLLSSQSLTAYLNGLQTSTPPAPTGEKAPQSVIPR